MIDHYGRGALDQFVEHRGRHRRRRPGPRAARPTRIMRPMRQNSSAAIFCFNLTSALGQITGITQSIPRVGYGHMASAVARIFRDASAASKSSATWVQAKSSFMRTRSQTFLREIAEANRRVSATGWKDRVKAWGYYPMTKMQQAVDTVTWIAAYDQASPSPTRPGSRSPRPSGCDRARRPDGHRHPGLGAHRRPGGHPARRRDREAADHVLLLLRGDLQPPARGDQADRRSTTRARG
jgi:hypothetical protein